MASPTTRSADRQAAVAQAVLGVALSGLGAFLVLAARDLDLPAERLAGMSASVGLGLIAVGLAGPILLRRGPHSTLRGGAIVLAAGCVLFAVAPTVPVAIAGVLLLGAGTAALNMVTPALLAGDHLAQRLSRVIAVGSIVAVLAPMAIGALDSTGVTGRLLLVPLVIPLLMLAASRPAHTTEPSPARTAEPPPESPQRPRLGAVARRWTAVVLAVSIEFCFTIWAVARLTEAGVSASVAALLGAAFPAGMAIGRILAPPLLARLPAVPIGGALTAAAAVAVAVIEEPVGVTVALAVAGVGVATLYPVTLAALVATPGLSARHAVSIGTVASGTAILLAPTALAAIGGHTGLRLAFLITVPLIVAVIAVHGLRRTAGPQPAGPTPAADRGLEARPVKYR
ncbi:MFS transporter [Dactylosporangium sp. NPDC051541]|uniref:MFS transporter n=1 Tax=Dactylosporangium sp. NPDC051541 TaxID=3363977 RepID=UPI0037A6712D